MKIDLEEINAIFAYFQSYDLVFGNTKTISMKDLKKSVKICGKYEKNKT